MTGPRRAVFRALAALYRAYYATLRLSAVARDGARFPPGDHPMDREIFAICEHDALALAGLAARRSFTVLVAHGRDGDWATVVLEALGCRVVRGSSLRGGGPAALELLAVLSDSPHPACIVADGPLGPDLVAKSGAAVLGERTGRPVRAVGAAAGWPMRIPRTWSRIYLPAPFSRVIVACDDPLAAGDVSAQAGRDDAAARLSAGLRWARERAEEIARGRR